LLKCKQQLHQEKYLSTRELLVSIIRKEGLVGLYRGFWVTFNRDFLSFGIYFYSYFKIKDCYEERNSLTNLKLLFAGGVSGVMSWLITYPFDTLKTVIQTQNQERYLKQIEAYSLISKETNSKFYCIFKGLTPTLIRAFIVNAVIFYTNELCQNICKKFTKL
jgi:solute carrier family 25 carnitine/acylcarnitine transporter 20/29